MDIQVSESLKITKRKIRSIGTDPEKTAKAVNLVYVSDTQPGITRVKNADRYDYFYKDKKIEDDEELLRIKHLVIPPAWENVWICKLENGHLQATGFDVQNGMQREIIPSSTAFWILEKYYLRSVYSWRNIFRYPVCRRKKCLQQL